MTKDEYAQGLIGILEAGWGSGSDDLWTRFGMGRAETCWLAQIPAPDRPDYWAFARENIFLELGGEPISLHEFLGSY